MANPLQFPGNRRKRVRTGEPRRTWHGADRERLLLKAQKARFRDLGIRRVELVATLAAGLAGGLILAVFFWLQDARQQAWSQPPPGATSTNAPQRWVVADLDTGRPAPVLARPSGNGGISATLAGQEGIRFGLCHVGGGTNCVVDGDTIWMDGVKIRVADIDAPETHPPRCAAEADLGDRATNRLQALLNAGPVTLEPIGRDEDRYGRKLRIIVRNGVSLGEILVSEGLARPYQGGPRQGWC